jgi:NAD(P)-dependent dehydrogenase (short-subunit alcohol dehydrogenase family)
VAETVKAFGRLDSFVGAAAISEFTMFFTQMPIEKVEETFNEVIGVNLKGYVLGALAAVPELRKTEGSIVLTLSPAGFFPGGGGPVYTLSKHAGVGLVRQLAFELAPTIRVTAVSPGAIPGSDLRGPSALGQQEMSLQGIPREQHEAMVKRVTPLAMYPDPEGYFPIYALLAGQDSKLTTGAVFHWDQGTQLVGFGMAGLRDLAEQS